MPTACAPGARASQGPVAPHAALRPASRRAAARGLRARAGARLAQRGQRARAQRVHHVVQRGVVDHLLELVADGAAQVARGGNVGQVEVPGREDDRGEWEQLVLAHERAVAHALPRAPAAARSAPGRRHSARRTAAGPQDTGQPVMRSRPDELVATWR